MKLEIPLCKKHLWMRKIGTIVGGLLLPTVLWMGIMAIQYTKPSLILFGLLGSFLGLLLLGWARNPIWVVRMMDDKAIIQGVDSQLVDICSIPSWEYFDEAD